VLATLVLTAWAVTWSSAYRNPRFYLVARPVDARRPPRFGIRPADVSRVPGLVAPPRTLSDDRLPTYQPQLSDPPGWSALSSRGTLYVRRLGQPYHPGFAYAPFALNREDHGYLAATYSTATVHEEGMAVQYEELAIPYPTLLLAATTPPGLAALARAVRRRRLGRCARASVGPRCAVCGYDLRATPGRCPECGATPRVT
jgi:hypothetical protein